jgi:putative tryptophan/tyrosine transport system substrate-binding protein
VKIVRCQQSAFGLILTVVLFVLCFRVEAQQPNKVPRVGYLGSGSRSSAGAGFTSGDVEAFRQGLRDLGYIEGQNITIGYRYAEGMAERLPTLRLSWCDSR